MSEECDLKVDLVGNEDGRDGWEENDDDNISKPRRLEEDLVTYLLSLEKEISAKDVDEETRSVLVENVLSELRKSMASAACDRRTNLMLEKICYAASLANIVDIATHFTPYAVFMARNRHSSHVVQALFARLCHLLKLSEEELPNDLGSVILALINPILKEMSWLLKEQAASHVIRSCFCVLAGIPSISERKGKGSKHKHSVALSEPLDKMLQDKCFYISNSWAFDVPEEFHETLGTAVVTGLLSLSTSELQDIVANSSSVACIGLLLRILLNPDFIMGGSDLAERLIRTTLQWGGIASNDSIDTESISNENLGPQVAYAISGDKSGSYFLETVIECSSVHFFIELVKGSFVTRCSDYCEDPTANFALQAVLRRLSAELEKTQVQLDVNKNLLSLGKTLLKEIWSISSTDGISSLMNTRSGVVLWLLELARLVPRSSSKDGKKEKNSWTSKIGFDVISTWIGKIDDSSSSSSNEERDKINVLSKVLETKMSSRKKIEEENNSEDNKKKMIKNINPRGIIPKLSDHDPQQILCSRILCALMKSDVLEEKSPGIICVQALAKLNGNVLLHLCTSGPLSRAILDPFLNHAHHPCSDDQNNTCMVIFLRHLDEHLVTVASSFIGQHFIRQAFAKSDPESKELIVQKLAVHRDQLKSTKEGRNSATNCHLDLYLRKKDEWLQMVNKQNRANEMIFELEGGIKKKKSAEVLDLKNNASNDSYQTKSSNDKSYIRNERSRTQYHNSGEESFFKMDASNDEAGGDVDKSKEKKKRKRSAADLDKRKEYWHKRQLDIEEKQNLQGVDYEKISRLKTTSLDLNLQAEVEKLQSERLK